MGRYRKKPGLPKPAQFVQLINAFRAEPAWKALSCPARVVYVEIKSIYNGMNNGQMMASVRWLAQGTGLSKGAVEKALRDLQEHGFIVQMRGGYLGPEGKAQGALWRLTEVGYTGDRPSREYQNWRPKFKSLSHEKGQRVPREGTGVSYEKGQGVPREGTVSAQNGGGGVPREGTIYNMPPGGGETGHRDNQKASGGSGGSRTFAIITGGVVIRHGVRTARHGSRARGTAA